MCLMASPLRRYIPVFYPVFTCMFLVGFCLNDLLSIQAQAIMFLAGNGPPVTPNTQGQGQIVMLSGCDDGFMGNKAHPSQPGSALPTLSHLGSQPGGGSCGNDELMAGKTKGAFPSTTNQPEASKLVTSLGSTTPTYIPAGTVLCCLCKVLQSLQWP